MDAKKVDVLLGAWVGILGALVSDAKDRDMSRKDHESAINQHHTALFNYLRDRESAFAELITKIHDLGLIYEAGCDIDIALSELEQLAERIGAPA